MPISTEWDDAEQTIIRMTFSGAWQWQELYAAVQHTHTMIDSVEYPVYIVADLGKTTWIPGDLVLHATKLIHNRHPRTRALAVVSTNPLAREFLYLLSALAVEMLPAYRFVETLAEGRAFIQQLKDSDQS